MSWNVSDIPDQTGRIAVVTGANGGLGLESARALAGAGAHVVMAARSPEKTQNAFTEVLASHPGASLEIVQLDLASLESVRRAAAAIIENHPVIDILINNAGLMALPERHTTDGFEMQLGVNHLGHWVLTADLLPALLAADAARIITVTSTAHHIGRPIDPDNPHLEGRYGPWRAYGQSKLANYHFALGLEREFERRGLRAASLVAHPGLSHTGLQDKTVEEGGGGFMAPFWAWMARHTGMSSARGALPQLRAATDPRAKGGQMYAPRFVNNGAPVRRPILRRIGMDRSIGILWNVSQRETGVSFDFGTGRETS